ncbi:hypothetical protein VE02_04026 [Pseudogymnoascus sp. 03VT05]|nr:hypothetical protein VE02_04026 [Pseudogymnoascus sp. 03VT05]
MGAFTNAAGRLAGRPKNEKEDEAAESPPITSIFGPDSTAIAPETLRAQDAAEREERVPLARQATAVEKEMSTWTCVRAFWPAVLQAIILSCACIMEGFDLVLITGFLTNPVFRRRYQCPDASLDGKVCEIPASWQSAIVIGPTVGQMAGVLLSGWLVERFGYKRTFMASLVALSAFIFIVFFAGSLTTFLVGLLLCGLPWGVFQTLTTNYASDVCPTPIRAYVTAWSNVCWIIGQCLGAVTQRALVNNMTMLSIQIPLGLQWVFPLPIFIFSLWAQESPWWLVRKGRTDEARKVLTKLVSQSRAPEGYSIDGHLAMIQLTNADELRETNGTGTGYIDCFLGVNRRRTEISTFTWVIQNASGSALMQWSPYFFQRAGMAPEQTWNFVIVQYALGLVGTAVSWCLLGRFGRRTIELWGLFLLTFVLTICGIIATIGLSAKLTGWLSGSLLLLYTLVYGCTIGPVTYALVSELSSTRTKSKTINIARMGYNAFGVFNCVVTPYQLNPTALNWGMKTAWFWVVFCALCFVYAFFRIPEPRGRTYAEMDWLFAEGISARKFASTVVPRFGDEMEVGEAASSSVESYEKKGGGVVEADGGVMPRSGSLGSSDSPAVATVESVAQVSAGKRTSGEVEGGKKKWRFW